MNSDLPATSTAELLELLAPLVPDDFINDCWPTGSTGGRRRGYTAAQLYRVHLLSLLAPVHALNLLVKLLPEQRAWRKFAGLRRIKAQLLQPVIARYAWQARSAGLIDATDLPAAGVGFKNKHGPMLGGGSRAGWPHAQDRAEPLFCRLQEAHPPVVAA